MSHHEEVSIDPNAEVKPNEEIGEFLGVAAGDSVEEDEIRRYTYDPNSLPTFSAHDMSRLEDEIHAAWDRGDQDEAIEGGLHQRLRELGIDPSQSQGDQGDVQVVRFIGADGKEDIRAIVLSSRDFGTKVARNTELVPITTAEEAHDHGEDDIRVDGQIAAQNELVTPENVGASEDNNEEDTEAAKAEAEEKFEALKTELFNATHEVDKALEGVKEADRNANRYLEALKEMATTLVRKINYGEGVSTGFVGEAEAVAHDAKRFLATVHNADNFLKSREQTLANAMEERTTSSREISGESRQERIASMMRRSDEMKQELSTGIRGRDSAGAALFRTVNMITNILAEMQTSRYGREDFASQLQSQLHGLERAAYDLTGSTTRISLSIVELKKVFA